MTRALAIICAVFAGSACAQDAAMASDVLEDGLSLAWAQDFKQQIAACYLMEPARDTAQRRFVELAFEMGPDARPVEGSIRFAAKSGVPGEEAAYRAARRAILRCGASGYDLPLDLFSQWNFVQLSFVYPVPLGEQRPQVRATQ